MSSQAPDLGGPVPREIAARLDRLVAELLRWQRRINLIGPASAEEVWHRHVADSLQLAPLAAGPSWCDLGAGGGFPGLVVAAARPDLAVTLIESDGRKCAFLRQAAAASGIAAEIREGRIEAVLPTLHPSPATISARALAPLDRLLALALKPLEKGAIGLFPKGRAFARELTQARESWRFEVDILPSRTDAEARILRIRDFQGPVA